MSSLTRRRVAEDGETEKKFAQGQRLQSRERFADAEARYRKVLAVNPVHIGALTGLTECLIALKRERDAVGILDRAAEGTDKDARFLFDLANLCSNVKHASRARSLYERVLELDPENVPALINLGHLVDEQGETQHAVDLLSRAIELKPLSARAYGMLGKVLTGTSLHDDAMACYRRSIELDPGISQTWTNLGALLEILGRHREALDALHRALTIDPDCDAARWNLARVLLMVGETEAGWDMYGFGFACGQRQPYRPFPGLIWEGQDLTGKTIMVWREQGLGDDLFFSTCYTDLIARAGHVIIETDPRLVPLYRRTWPQATVRPEAWKSTGLGNYGEVDFDYTAPAGLVAAQLRRRVSDFPSAVNPLVPDPVRVAECRDWLASLGPGPKIGLSWTSKKVDDIRSINYTALADWKALFEIGGVQVVNLQYTNVDAEAEALEREFGLTLHRMPGLDLFKDIEGAAALTSCMDAAVVPSSFPAVLAGALGITCFYYSAPHGWTRLGTDRLPWFPSMRCYSVDHTTDKAKLAAGIVTDVARFLGK
ncbi:MAG: tetratricopeptide repeat protein [Parvibaculum sp.]|uniref:tetratricopeptide repeat protein n=1 Tax=Parvibaculum sp. TaxID=2024848 RepID=UPI001B028A27|nr:tetratricopeptide repeat protein [Parvibaculum sp.]MBO6668968.1 tetratricopeptide repeat protein [Parvibaculum sp.]MBO6692107.1 tetratricopeptide repeat protein [Parvibaculum sp.]